MKKIFFATLMMLSLSAKAGFAGFVLGSTMCSDGNLKESLSVVRPTSSSTAIMTCAKYPYIEGACEVAPRTTIFFTEIFNSRRLKEDEQKFWDKCRKQFEDVTGERVTDNSDVTMRIDAHGEKQVASCAGSIRHVLVFDYIKKAGYSKIDETRVMYKGDTKILVMKVSK
jgi:hypothetical protein